MDNRYKRSLITTMLDRAYRISSDWSYFSQECDRLETVFLKLKVAQNSLKHLSPGQTITTLLGATGCVRLATVLRCVSTCWVLLAQISPISNLSQQHPTCCTTSQHGGQTHATCCAQQCCDVLCWHVAIVWPGLKLLGMVEPRGLIMLPCVHKLLQWLPDL